MTSILDKAILFTKFALRDIQCGHHSGFKPCCIFFFAILDNASHFHKQRFYTWRRYANRIVSQLRGKKFGYIPCPVCLFGEPVKVLSCKRELESHTWDFATDEDFNDYHSMRDNTEMSLNLDLINRLFKTYRDYESK